MSTPLGSPGTRVYATWLPGNREPRPGDSLWDRWDFRFMPAQGKLWCLLNEIRLLLQELAVQTGLPDPDEGLGIPAGLRTYARLQRNLLTLQFTMRAGMEQRPTEPHQTAEQFRTLPRLLARLQMPEAYAGNPVVLTIIDLLHSAAERIEGAFHVYQLGMRDKHPAHLRLDDAADLIGAAWAHFYEHPLSDGGRERYRRAVHRRCLARFPFHHQDGSGFLVGEFPDSSGPSVGARNVGGVMSHELDDLARSATHRLLQVHQVFSLALEGRLPRSRQNVAFLNEMLEPLFVDAFNGRSLAPPTIYGEPDDYPHAVRVWLTTLGQAVGGYRPDWTDVGEARHIHEMTSRAPSVQALMDGTHRVSFSSITGTVPPERFREWVAAGSTTVGELAVDAANYAADIGEMSAGLRHAMDAVVDDAGQPIPADEVTGDMFAEFVHRQIAAIEQRVADASAPDHPVHVWGRVGESIRAKFDEARRGRGLSVPAFNRAIRRALALPSRPERGMVWLSLPSQPALEIAQTVWIYEQMFTGSFDEGDGLLDAALGEL